VAEERTVPPGTLTYGQLTQRRVPLHEAADAFILQDASGHIPIVVIPERLYRYLNALVIGAGVVLVACLLAAALLDASSLVYVGIALGAVMLVLGIVRWFYVTIPEGVQALTARGGRHQRIIGSGYHFLPPYISVTHLVTRREIPFDVPLVAARTVDEVRAEVDTLITFSITDPARFVYQISASDFDQIFQAAAQEALRSLIRSIPSERLGDLVGRDAAEPRLQVEAIVGTYGVTVHQIIVTFAQPPAAFVNTQESRQIAVLQRAEQLEKQALAQRRQADTEELARQTVLARAERERETLSAQLQQVAARRQIVDQEAEVEAARFAHLEERLRRYPLAAQYELQRARIEVANALAGNTRAILQVGNADDIAQALVMREMMHEVREQDATNGLAARVANNDHEPTPRPEGRWLSEGTVWQDAVQEGGGSGQPG
jgi:regulator of protease activity HflC (stomatin/prohibitin superfamily)